MTDREYSLLQRTKPVLVHSARLVRIHYGNLVIEGKCPWLTKDYKCSVYEVRPAMCKALGEPNLPCHKMPGGMKRINAIIDRLKL